MNAEIKVYVGIPITLVEETGMGAGLASLGMRLGMLLYVASKV